MSVPRLRFKDEHGRTFPEWTLTSINESVIKVIDGDRGENYPNGNDFSNDGYCLFLNAKNVTKFGFAFEDVSFITKEKDEKLRKGKLKRNDLIITTRGSVGNIAFYNDQVSYENMRINSGMVILRIENSEINPKYLYQYFYSPIFTKLVQKISFGSAQPQLTVLEINKFSVGYPSNEEQTKIANFLTAVDEKITQLTQKCGLLAQYKKGVMQQIFSQQLRFKPALREVEGNDDGQDFPDWEEKKLGELGKFIGGGTPTTGNTNFWKGNIPWVSSSDLTDESIFRVNVTRFISSDAIANSATKLVPKNSILIVSRVGVGKVAVTNQEICTSQDFTNLVLHSGNQIFFAYLIKTITHKLLELNQGTSIKGFVKSDLEELVILVPSEVEQTKIANFLTAIDDKINNAQAQLAAVKHYKQGLLQQMFV